MRLKLLGMFMTLFLSYTQLTYADESDEKEWIVYFTNLEDANHYHFFHPEQVVDQYDYILKVKLTDIEKSSLLQQKQVERIEPNYRKSIADQPSGNDPFLHKQWGLKAINFDDYIQNSSYFFKNELLGEIFTVNGREITYQGQPLASDTISVNLSSATLSRISVEIDHVESPWTLSIYKENGQLIASNKGDFKKLDILIPKAAYNQLEIVLTTIEIWDTSPIITDVIGVNHLTIAVIDSGIDLHEDFCGNILYTLGRDFKEGLTYPQDNNGHGTHVTGILAACSNNQLGISGVIGNAPIDILPLKVLDHRGFGGDFEISKAIQEAIDYKVDLINMSLAGKGETLVLRQSVKEALNQNIPIVAAAGNWNMSTEKIYPASYPGVITVSGMTDRMEKVPSSDFGWEVDISAPGYQILSTYLSNQYKVLNGTSMATPYVTGTLALIKLRYPDFGLIEIRDHLFKTSRDILDKGYDQYSGYGLLDLKSALNDDRPPSQVEWLSFKEGQTITLDKGQTIGFSSNWQGMKTTIFANDTFLEEKTISNAIETIDFTKLRMKNSRLHLSTIITDNHKKVFGINQISVKIGNNQDHTYTDISSDFWAYDNITTASRIGLVNGYQDGSFKPNSNLSRKHSVLILSRLFKWDSLSSYESPFLDVESQLNTANLAIFSAYENGVVRGNNHQLFYPEKPLTRGQMSLILARALHFSEIETSKSHSFKDIKPSDEYYYAVQQLTTKGIITEQDYFKPYNFITRGQFVAMIVRTFDYINRNS